VKKRLDLLLVERGLVSGRDRAKGYIMAGQVFVNQQKADKPGMEIDENSQIELRGEALRYVSRGGLKLEKALQVFPIDLAGAVCAALGGALIAANCNNLYLLSWQKKDMPQFIFAETLSRYEDPTLLNYGFLDGGFYYASGAKPADRYFCRLMADIPQMMQEQNACVREGRADYIVMQNQQLSDLPWIDTGLYELVDQAQFRFEGDWPAYYLYQLKR